MNKKAFRAVMTSHGDNQRAVATALGITEQTLGRKLNGYTDFTQSEIRALTKIYKLSPTEVDYIFFGAYRWSDL